LSKNDVTVVKAYRACEHFRYAGEGYNDQPHAADARKNKFEEVFSSPESHPKSTAGDAVYPPAMKPSSQSPKKAVTSSTSMLTHARGRTLQVMKRVDDAC